MENLTPETLSALAKLQAEIPQIHKDGTAKFNIRNGGSMSYTFAKLPSILEAIKQHLANNGFSHTQSAVLMPSGVWYCRTLLMHSSGGIIEGGVPIDWCASEEGISDMQAFGKAFSFARRYALISLLGISPEDDTDAADSGRKAQQAQKQQPQNTNGSASTNSKVIKAARTAEETIKWFLSHNDTGEVLTPETTKKLALRLSNLTGKDGEKEDIFLYNVFGVTSKTELSERKAKLILEWSKPYKDSAELWQFPAAVMSEYNAIVGAAVTA